MCIHRCCLIPKPTLPCLLPKLPALPLPPVYLSLCLSLISLSPSPLPLLAPLTLLPLLKNTQNIYNRLLRTAKIQSKRRGEDEWVGGGEQRKRDRARGRHLATQ